MKSKVLLALIALLLVVGASLSFSGPNVSKEKNMNAENNYKIATLAGGCFWCVESDLEKVKGVHSVVSGYAGGHVDNPTYDQVSSGQTGHLEVVQVHFDPQVVSYEKVLDVFLRHHDPTDPAGSFNDRGEQYTSAIFYHDEEQKKIAGKVLVDLDNSGVFTRPITTKLIAFKEFFEAEEYHQDYYKKNPVRYNWYRFLSGRDSFVEKHWGMKDKAASASTGVSQSYVRPSDDELQEILSPLQFKVTRKDGTEPAFNNEFWDNKREGIYVDVISGEPLFSSVDKFKSGTGWPSFTRPIEGGNVVEKEDNSFFMSRVEVRSGKADSHLGHVFNDGPQPTGLRYCINSASLRFIPKEELKEKGYEEFLSLFK